MAAQNLKKLLRCGHLLSVDGQDGVVSFESRLISRAAGENAGDHDPPRAGGLFLHGLDAKVTGLASLARVYGRRLFRRGRQWWWVGAGAAGCWRVAVTEVTSPAVRVTVSS